MAEDDENTEVKTTIIMTKKTQRLLRLVAADQGLSPLKTMTKILAEAVEQRAASQGFGKAK